MLYKEYVKNIELEDLDIKYTSCPCVTTIPAEKTKYGKFVESMELEDVNKICEICDEAH